MNESAKEPERELDELQDQVDSLGEEISGAREDWERKKHDPAVPGAGGDPHAAESDDPELTAYPAKGDDDELSGDEPLDPQDPANEDL